MGITVVIQRAEHKKLLADRARLDWLADPENHIGNVHLPVGAVTENLHCLRSAIDAAMTGNYEKNAPIIEPGYANQKKANG